MSGITCISPEILFHRHDLTTHQINSLFGRTVYPESPEEKITAFEMARELLSVAGAFDQEGLEFIPLKGPVLSHRLWHR